MDRAVSKIKKAAMIICCAVLVLMTLCPAAVSADREKMKTVRVGYYQSSNFQDGAAEDEEKSGYSYEYLQKVSYYSDWKYEYVYGSWSEIYEQFVDGDIDIMAGISYTEEREGKILFPKYEMGRENYYIYKHDADTGISAADVSSLNGKKIGVIKNNMMTDFLMDWTPDNQIDIETVEFDSFDKCSEAFYRNEIDALTATDNNVDTDSGMTPVVKIGESPYYLAVTGSRQDLLEDLNEALSMMNEVEPYFLETLQNTYFKNAVVSRQLSEKEIHWLTDHPVLHIGYSDDYMPYCGTDDEGSATGIMTDVVEAMLKEVAADRNVEVEYHAYDTDGEMVADLKSGKLDAVFPVPGSLTDAENGGYYVSAPAVTAGMYLVYSGAYNAKAAEKIAVSTANRKQYLYTREMFPDSEIVECDSIYDCLAAVDSGKANSTIINGARISTILRSNGFENMAYSLLPKSDDRCFAVQAGNDGLLLLINRGLKLIGSDYGINAMSKYTDTELSYSFGDFIKDNAVYVILFILVIALIIIFLLYKNFRHMKQQEKERARYQKELEENRKQAEAANNAKTSFLFNMSHDIRTPMNAIIGFTDLLKKNQDNPEKRADYLKKIQDSSAVLLSIINNVLEMARIEKGTVELVESAWSAEQYNDTLYSVFYDMMVRKGIEFTRQVNVQNHYVFCDSIKLREVFINILSNSYKYTEPGGEVHMLLEEIPSDREGYALYRTTITDTGVGISEEFLPHIFEEFTREKTSTDNKIEGTGLGMPIVKRLVEFMEGSIEVYSEKGVGTTFVVTIPHRIADRSDLADHAGVELDPNLFRGKRILLAEDNNLNAEIAIEILKEMGFETERAQNGQIAVDMLYEASEGYYDVILMDIQMPCMNGYEAARAIRAMSDYNKSSIPIIAMTANAFEEDRKEAMNAGMNDHLAKPIDVKELTKALAVILK